MTAGPTLPPVVRNEQSRSAVMICRCSSILALVPWPAVVAVSPPHAVDGCHWSSSASGARRFKGDIQLPRSTRDLLSGGCSAAGGCDRRRLDGGEALVPAPHDNLRAGQTETMADTAIFDVDGTLVDTNYQHALAWFRAFRRYGITLPMWRIHRGIGMGGDMFVPEVAGREVERAHGDDLRRQSCPRTYLAGSARPTGCFTRSRS